MRSTGVVGTQVAWCTDERMKSSWMSILVIACGGPSGPAKPTVPPTAPSSDDRATADVRAPVAPAPDAPTAAPTKDATWLTELDLASVPADAVTGEGNGVPFTIEEAKISLTDGQWWLKLNDKLGGNHQFQLPLDGGPEPGAKFDHAPEGLCGSFMQVAHPKSGAHNWQTARCAWKVEITKSSAKLKGVKPGKKSKVIGKASGRVILRLQDSGSHPELKDSWVSGTFTDLPVEVREAAN